MTPDQTRSAGSPRRGSRVVRAGRWVFLLAVLVGVSLALRGHGGEVLAAIGSTPPAAVLTAVAMVLTGLLLTSVAWLRLLAAFGHRLPGTTGRAVFFVGQLGKYVPGGVWSIGAHAHLAREHGVPVRVTASTSLAFLGLNLATAAVAVGGVAAAGVAVGPLSRPSGVALVLCGLATLVPAVVTRLAGLVAGIAPRLRWTDVLLLVVLMALTWTSYAAAVVVLAPVPGWSLLPAAAAAFALAYAIGVAIVVAPAGVGAREVTLVALLSPVLGIGPAGAVAVLTRVIHTGADLLLALLSWAVVRARGAVGAAAGRSSDRHSSTAVHGGVARDP